MKKIENAKRKNGYKSYQKTLVEAVLWDREKKPLAEVLDGLGEAAEQVPGKIDAPSAAGTAGQVLAVGPDGKSAWVDAATGGTYDGALSDSSTNAPQNKVVTAKLSELGQKVDDLPEISPEQPLSLNLFASGKYINGNGDFGSVSVCSLYAVDVSNLLKIHITNATTQNLPAVLKYAFYSTSDTSQMGSGTVVAKGDSLVGAYDITIDVPATALSCVIVGTTGVTPVAKAVVYSTIQDLTEVLIGAAKSDELTIVPSNPAPLSPFMTGKYINSDGSFVSNSSAKTFILDVTDIAKLRVYYGASMTASSLKFAFYSTDDYSLIGSATFISGGGQLVSPYDMNVDVPASAKTAVFCGFYGTYPSAEIIQYRGLQSFVSALIGNTISAEHKRKMYVIYKSAADELSIGCKYDSSYDLIVRFKPCMFNNLMTFSEVGLSANSADSPLTNPDRPIEKALNTTSSDNIGPVSVTGGTIGGNHSLNNDGVTKTAKMDSYSVIIDGAELSGDFEGFADSVVVQVKNTLFDPASPVVDNILTTPLIKENVLYRVENGDVSVMVNHKYLSTYYVNYYCGMQSMFTPTQMITPEGQFVSWTNFASVAAFTKSAYPDFDCYIAKNPNGYQVTWLDKSYGIGDHSLLGNEKDIFSINGSKQYHELVRNQSISANTELNWRGVYSWKKFVSEDSGYINFLMKRWAKDYYYIALKTNYSGVVPVELGTIGKLVESGDFVENALGVEVSGSAGDEIIIEVN